MSKMKYNEYKLPAQACANIIFKSAHTSTGNLFFYLYKLSSYDCEIQQCAIYWCLRWSITKINSQHRHVLISFSNQPTQVLGIYSSYLYKLSRFDCEIQQCAIYWCLRWSITKINSQHRHVLISYSNQPTQVLGIYSSISIRCPGLNVKYSSVQSIDV